MYGFTTTLMGVSFDQAILKTTDALKAEGFGILSDIDVQHVVNLMGQAEVRLVADAAEQRLRRACESLGGSATRAT